MSHLEPAAMQRVLRGAEGSQETESAAEHLMACERCRALAGSLLEELRVESRGGLKEGPLQLVYGLLDRERQWGVESLAAIAEWSALRRLPSQRSQRERVRMAKVCHTLAFFRLVIGELKEESVWKESEFLASLALLSAEGMRQRKQITQEAHGDLQAEVWTAIANARRRAAEWQRAHSALANAERHRKEGTGDAIVEAGILSITASTLADEGQITKAREALERCRSLYEERSDWALVARTLVQLARIVQAVEPAQGLRALDRAAPLIPAVDSHLRLLSELLRVECLIELQRPQEALQVFRRCLGLLNASPRIQTRIRGRFTAARLLDALGYKQQADRLFDEVVDQDVEHELYKDALLDLLYLYGRHLLAGELEKAARVCQRALTDASLAAVTHDQLRDLWSQLLDAAQRQAISQEVLRELRQYVSVHWKHPAAIAPVVAPRR